MDKIINQVFDEERALYGIKQTEVDHCHFGGKNDGESPLKECNDIIVDYCYFSLRYPLWHVDHVKITNTYMSDLCRAALWYDHDVNIMDCKLFGIKALRECQDVKIQSSNIQSSEFGWMNRNVCIYDCKIQGEYPFLNSSHLEICHMRLQGKYSFQYIKNAVIRNSCLDTKDAFWHSENVTVYDSLLKGEYLGWYSHNLKLVRCKIIGTQPLCYAKGLILEDCEMVNTDLSFENSEVKATIKGYIESIKNPKSGIISVDHVGSIIKDHDNSKVIVRVNDHQ